jgi:hypothetical protein
MEQREPVLTGGCQCGAVRYALSSMPPGAGICHCRMCQRATGGLFAALAGVPNEDFTWTHGTPAVFMSSDRVERHYCRDCGTPLTYKNLDWGRTSVTVGSLDEPERITFRIQVGIESRLPVAATLNGLPERATAQEISPNQSRQHPLGR